MRQRVVSQAWVFFLAVMVFGSITTGLATFAGDEIASVVQNSPGFSAESGMSYQNLGNGESVNPLTGSLTVVHGCSINLPQNLGRSLQPSRIYNAKRPNDSGYFNGGHAPAPEEIPYGPLGWGWTLSYGRIFCDMQGTVTDGVKHYYYNYYYVDESGARHRLFAFKRVTAEGNPESLLLAETNETEAITPAPPPEPLEPANLWFVTNDGSYIRVKYQKDFQRWTIYFPDGSKRLAGDRSANGYIAPVIDTNDFPKNPNTLGWYVTEIHDRAGNQIHLTYRPYSLTAATGKTQLAGSIATITDSFGRVITFNYTRADSLLGSISTTSTFGPREEKYDYTTVLEMGRGGLRSYPALSLVEDPVHLKTRYAYTPYYRESNGVQILLGSFLTEIGYPTGGLSKYLFERFAYLKARRHPLDTETPIDSETFTVGVKTHEMNYRPDSSSNDRVKLTWSWEHHIFAREIPGLGYASMKVQPVVTRDPLGTEEVRYFSAEDRSDSALPPGIEIFSVRRYPGAPSLDFTSPQFDPWNGAISWSQKKYEWGGNLNNDDDSIHCFEWVGGIVPPQLARLGNMRPKWVEQGERTKGGVILWKKLAESRIWDGQGHYAVTMVTDGTPIEQSLEAQATLVEYLRTDPIPNPHVTGLHDWTNVEIIYQTDRLTKSLSGRTSDAPDFEYQFNDKGLEYLWSISLPGSFRAALQTFDLVTGLPVSRREFVTPAGGGSIHYEDTVLFAQPPLNGALQKDNDKLLAIAYTPQGNISKLTYTGGDLPASGTRAQYVFNFTWDRGMVSQMDRDGSPYGVEFVRAIDSTTSLITGATDPNGLTTSYQYDVLNRLTKITPPNGEYATYISYPNDSDTAGTAHDIFFYRGPPTFTPTVSDNLANLDGGAAYQHYIFDDLGRLVKTRSIHPEGYLTETMTAYDPLGNAFFTSLPYRTDAPPPQGTLNWDILTSSGTLLPVEGDAFVSKLVMNPLAINSPYGSATSKFAGATWPDANNSGLEKLIQGDRELFDRTIWSFSPSGNRTKTAYAGLNSGVTLFGIKTGATINPNDESTTWYNKDIWGRLSSVVPPEGTSAVYAYNNLDQLTSVNLSGQIRSFTYDALGRILTANNPENKKTTYLGYDCIGNLIAAQDANGADSTSGKVSYKLVNEYDLLGRLLRTKKADATTGATIQLLIENTYDRLEGDEVGDSLGKLVRADSYTEEALLTVRHAWQKISYGGFNGRPDSVTQGTDASKGELEYALANLQYNLYGQLTNETLPGQGGQLVNAYQHGAIFSQQETLSGQTVLSGINYRASGAAQSYLLNGTRTAQTAFDAYERALGFGLKAADNTLIWGNGSLAQA